MPTVRADTLLALIEEIFRAHSVPAEEARTVAEHLVDAEACGLPSHGVMRVPQYLQAIADGHTRPGAKLRTLSETPATVVLDGGQGFGQVMARQAMDAAVAKAELTGVGVATLRNCSHTGRLGSYTEQATRRGMAGLMMVNAGGHGQWVAPHGGTAGRLATNPLSIAVPTDGAWPLVLDMATSAAPEGKIRALLAAGQVLPLGWVVNAAGQATQNPADLYGPPRGALLPFGGHKGFGLALLIEALAGGLSGAGCCTTADAPMAGKTDGVFLMAVQIRAFTPLAGFARTMTEVVRHVKSSPPVDAGNDVLVPGEAEARQRERSHREGIALADVTWNALQACRRA